MRTARLKEVAKVVSGGTPKTGVKEYWGGDIPWATPADLSKLSSIEISDTPRKITESGLRSCAAAILPTNSVLLSSRAPIGHVAINKVPMATNQGFKSLVPGPDLNTRYLYHWLRFKNEFLKTLGNGATFKELSKRATEEILIPLPYVEEQRRIAATLDQADAIQVKLARKRHALQALKRALFYSMFPLDQNLRPLGDIADLISGTTLPRGVPFVGQSGGALLMKVSDMNLVGNNQKIISAGLWNGEAPGKSTTVPAGAVVFPKRGAAIATNKKRLTTRETTLDPNLMGVVANDAKIIDEYLVAWFNNFDLTNITSGSSVPQLNKKDLAPLMISVPPLEDQKKFAVRSIKIDEQCGYVDALMGRYNELCASLQSRAFKGEL